MQFVREKKESRLTFNSYFVFAIIWLSKDVNW